MAQGVISLFAYLNSIGANTPLGSVGLPASAHSSQAVLPIRPAANAFR